jgi:hypothetical protein
MSCSSSKNDLMIRYRFDPIFKCEMCDDLTKKHKIIGQRLNTSQGLRPKAKKGISVTIHRCNNCGLIYSNPQPIPFDISDHYEIPPESYWSASYFAWDENYFSGQITMFKNWSTLNPKCGHWILVPVSGNA